MRISETYFKKLNHSYIFDGLVARFSKFLWQNRKFLLIIKLWIERNILVLKSITGPVRLQLVYTYLKLLYK